MRPLQAVKMVELIRQDGNVIVNLIIEAGETILGRGPLLKIEATSISRQHAKILVDDKRVVLTCLHKNPIMVKKVDWKELGKDEQIGLQDEDEFKFLENDCHFKVRLRGGNSRRSPIEGSESKPETKKRKLPVWMSSPASPSPKIKRSYDKIISADKENGVPTCIFDAAELEDSSPPMIPSPSLKDSHTNSEVTENFNNSDLGALEVAPDRKNHDDMVDNGGRLDNNTRWNGRKDRSSIVRQSCVYGSSCYRKNPAHRAQEAHPEDSDYDDPAGNPTDDEDDDRPECEFGTACYRKNPDHKKQFKHCNRPQPKRGAKEKKKDKIVKNKKRNDDYDSDFIDDDDNWSPVDDTDDDEDWTPKLSPENDD